MVEVPEERERLLRGILLALGVAAFGLLAGVALTGVVVGLTVPFALAVGISPGEGCRIALPTVLAFRRSAGRFIYGPDKCWKRNARN